MSPIDQRFLDLLDRIEEQQESRIADLARRLEEAERRTVELADRLGALETTVTRETHSVQKLTATLERLLDPAE
jgi:flagellar biosynthesis chaperone FliJ